MAVDKSKMQAAWRQHGRKWGENRYVYAVVSRRSRGMSIGINLNPDKACNFDCIYCQVDRRTPPLVRKVDLHVLEQELYRVLESERSHELYTSTPFDLLAPEQHGIRDIAFSGDGEPTTFPRFKDAVSIAAEARRHFALDAVKLVLITDAAYLAKPAVRSALDLLHANNGEIWAKLDAGTEEYFHRVDRPNVPLQKVLNNILEVARDQSLVIQTLWMRIKSGVPPRSEIEAYCRQLNHLLQKGAQLKALQLYTIARDPAESYVSSLMDTELDDIAAAVRRSVAVPVETYYGTVIGPSGNN
jgi:wyosine [tRNA(Phe)-imidazoG37] synthetase (radical SAM superfamily)